MLSLPRHAPYGEEREHKMKNELAVVKVESNSLAKKIYKMEIVSQSSLETAVDLLRQIVIVRKRAEGLFDPQIDAAYKTWQISLQQKKTFLAPLLEAEKSIKNKKTEYELEQERIAEEKLAKEKAKLAKKLVKTIDEEKIAILNEELDNMVVEPVVTNINGTSRQKDWNIKVADKKKLLSAVINGELDVDIDNLIEIKINELKKYLRRSNKNEIVGCICEKTLIQKVNFIKG